MKPREEVQVEGERELELRLFLLPFVGTHLLGGLIACFSALLICLSEG